MAEISNLTVVVSVELMGLKEFSSAFNKLSATITKSGNEITSTFEQISKHLDLLAKKLNETNEKISLFGVDLDISKDQTGA
ncbi:MAG: hypothetical protein ACRENZ_02755 [Thermodesulfobacteriota bacterium]